MNSGLLLQSVLLSGLFVLSATTSLDIRCDSSHTKLLLFVDFHHSTNTVTRLKNIVSYFEAKVKSGIINTLDVCLVDPFQSRTLFNLTDVTSSLELTSAFNHLTKANLNRDENDTFSGDRETLLYEAFDNVFKIISDVLADMVGREQYVIVAISSCRGICDRHSTLKTQILKTKGISELIILLEMPTKRDALFYHNYGYLFYDLRIPVIFIDSEDDFGSYNPVTIDHCRDCPWGWTRYVWSTHRISCYWLRQTDTDISKSKASSMCESVKSSLPALETRDELEFLTNLLEKHSNTSMAEPATVTVSVGLHKRFGLQQNNYMWSNSRPFNLEAIVEGSCDIMELCVAVSFNFKSSNQKNIIKWKTVNCEKSISKILVCEMEGLMVHDFTGRMDKIVNETRANIFEYTFQVGELSKLPLGESRYENWGMFDCRDNLVKNVTYRLVCDGSIDCYNGRDEQFCYNLSPKEEQSNYFFCRNPNRVGKYPARIYIPSEERCNKIQDCPDNSDEQGCDVCLGRKCDDRTCVPSHWLSRDHDKCSPFMEISGNWYLNVSYPSTGQSSMQEKRQQEITSCSSNNKKQKLLVEWAPKCLHLRGSDGSTIGCRNKRHLRDCVTFRCPEGFLKCPDSYCVPVYNFIDGVKDCPYGEDEEMNDITFNGTNNTFRCQKSMIYIHKVHLCDGIPQCPFGDDETYCNVTCPNGFRCNGQAVEVYNHTLVPEIKSLNIIDVNTKYLDVSGIDLSKLEETFIFPSLLRIQASYCNLVRLDGIFYSEYDNRNLYDINLAHNNITTLHNHGPLASLTNLQFLSLSHNRQLTQIQTYSLVSEQLCTIDLSYTGISSLDLFIFNSIESMQWINLSNTNIVHFHHFHYLRLEFLYLENTQLSTQKMSNILKSVSVSSGLFVDNFKFCCPQISGAGIPKHLCHAPPDAFSSCEDLLSDVLKRSLLWLVAGVSLSGNGIVVTYRLFYDRGVFKKGYGVFVTNLSVSDCIMGVYLLIIASTDLLYRDEYLLHESDWRHSSLCQAAGFLSTLSSETSTFFVFLITLDRYLVIRFPFGDHRLTKLGLVICVLFVWIIGFILASVPLMYPEWIIYSSNGMCLGLPLGISRNLGWHYSFGIFICVNFIMFIFIAFGQMYIFRLISSSHSFKMTNVQSVARRAQEINIAKQLFLVVLSNFLCWFPICILGFRTLTGHEVSPDTYAWLVVFVMPLNAAINPMIYTIPVMYSKWRDFKRGGTSRSRGMVNKLESTETKF